MYTDDKPVELGRHMPVASDCRRSTGLDLCEPTDAEVCTAALSEAILSGAPARVTASRSRHAVIGTFPSAKMGETFPSESSVEESVFVLAEVLESVRAYRPQAVRIRFLHQGRPCSAYPDVAVERTDGLLELWECKPQGSISKDALARLVVLRASLRSIGVVYRVRQPPWSKREPRAANARLVLRYADYRIPTTLLGAVRKAMHSGVNTLGALRHATDADMHELLALVAVGKLGLDIGWIHICDASTVRLPTLNATSGAFDGSANPQGD